MNQEKQAGRKPEKAQTGKGGRDGLRMENRPGTAPRPIKRQKSPFSLSNGKRRSVRQGLKNGKNAPFSFNKIYILLNRHQKPLDYTR